MSVSVSVVTLTYISTKRQHTICFTVTRLTTLYFTVSGCISVLTLTCISIERWYAICFTVPRLTTLYFTVSGCICECLCVDSDMHQYREMVCHMFSPEVQVDTEKSQVHDTRHMANCSVSHCPRGKINFILTRHVSF